MLSDRGTCSRTTDHLILGDLFLLLPLTLAIRGGSYTNTLHYCGIPSHVYEEMVESYNDVNTVKPLKKRHIGDAPFVPSREVVLFWRLSLVRVTSIWLNMRHCCIVIH